MKLSLLKALVISALSLVVSTTGAQAFRYTGQVLEAGPEQSAIARWCEAAIEPGDTRGWWPYTQAFYDQMNLSGVPGWEINRLIKTTADLSNISSEIAARRLQAGQLLWLPCMDNDPADIRARLTGAEVTPDAPTPDLIDPEAMQRLIDGQAELLLGGDAANQATYSELMAMLESIDVRLADTSLGVAADKLPVLVQSAADLRTIMDGVKELLDGEVRFATLAAIEHRLSVVSRGLSDLSAEISIAAVNNRLDTTDAALATLGGRVTTAEETAAKAAEDAAAALAAANAARVAAEAAAGDDDVVSQLADPDSALNGALDGKADSSFMSWLAAAVLIIAMLTGLVIWRGWKVKKTADEAKIAAEKAAKEAADALQTANAAKAVADQAAETNQKAANDIATAVSKAADAEATAMSALTLATQIFDDVHGLMPQQSFPTQAALDALSVGGSINLVFETDRKHYNLTIHRDEKGLKIEGLTARGRVVVTDHKSVITTIRRAFAKAKAEKGSAVHAFAPVKAVKAA